MRRKATVWLAACVATAALGSTALAQRPEQIFQRTYFYEERVRARLERDVPPAQRTEVEWGGFFVSSYTFYDDIDRGHAHQSVQDLRLWTQVRFDEVHRIFARMQLLYSDYAAGDARGFRQHDLVGPNLEVGYYELDVSGAAAKYWNQTWPFGLTARGGRQFIEVGRGIALSQTLDAGWFELETADLALVGFAGRTIESVDNIDVSVPGFTRSRRTVYGAEARVLSIEDHEPYAFLVWQRDWSEEKPNDPAQDYRYDSRYFGLGCSGNVGPRTGYVIEGIYECGTSVANGQQDDEEPIRAWALDAEIEHFCDHPMQPVVALEYAYASGDGDRGRATTAFRGNTPGTDDTAFQGFGFVNSGLSLGARFTNLQFLRLGGRLTPYENRLKAGRLDVGCNYYFLWKADREGPISDLRAMDTSAEVGHEVDVFVEWRVFSDLTWSLHYGRFFPGQAYFDRDPRDFLFTGLSFSF